MKLDLAIAADAAKVLRRHGAVILLPTETVYGLVCRASDSEAIARIYQLKSRDPRKMLAWLAYDWRSLEQYGLEFTRVAERLATRYCPGPVTLIVRRGESTQGFRIPDHPLVLEILRLLGEPLANTSANLSGHPNALDVASALKELDGKVDLAIDGGAILPDALASTVVDCTQTPAQILRQGKLVIPPEELF